MLRYPLAGNAASVSSSGQAKRLDVGKNEIGGPSANITQFELLQSTVASTIRGKQNRARVLDGAGEESVGHSRFGCLRGVTRK